MSVTRLVCTVVTATALINSSASAQSEVSVESESVTPPNRSFVIGAFAGGKVFDSEIELGNARFEDQIPRSGVLFGLRGGYRVLDGVPGFPASSSLSLEAEAKLSLSSTEGNTDEMRGSFTSSVLGWRAHAMLTLLEDRKVSPFVVLGVGGETMFSDSPFVESGDTDFAWHWGLGALYRIADAYGLRLDARHGITAARSKTATSTFELHLGFFYAFAGTPQRKATPPTVVAKVEQPVKPAPPKKAVDSDDDGFPDDKDTCPTQPEIFNEIDDDDGCPEVDSDNDGLLGRRDKCPDAAEDKDGFEDEDGCPDTDNDKDGRLDKTDQCPMKAETLNGFRDEDGCPDEIPQQVARFTGVIQGIRFASGSSKIHRRTYRLLDQAVEVFKKYPSVRIRISGHTDIKGKHGYNVELSRKRADAVKWYLADKGIDNTRLVTVGHGPDKPIADNSTRKGRQKNRRIEFQLMQGAAAEPTEALPTTPAKPTAPAQPKAKPSMKAKPAKAGSQ